MPTSTPPQRELTDRAVAVASESSVSPTLPHRELTVRAVVVAVVVAALMGASYPAVVLRIGYGPNISVVSAFLGYIAITLMGLLTGSRGTRQENNLVQTAGTAAGQAGFMAVVIYAIDLLNQEGLLNLHLTPFQVFAWLSVAGLLGVLLAVPLRKHYIDEENLPFADGTAAGETLLVLDEGAKAAAPRLMSLGVGSAISATFALLREIWHKIPENWAFPFIQNAAQLRIGTEIGVLSLGAGILIGLRVTLSMAIGMILAWFIAPQPLFAMKLVPELTFNMVLRYWVMWPATGLMISGGLTALVLNFKVISKTFHGLSLSRKAKTDGSDFPMRYVVIGSIFFAVLLAVIQKVSLDFPIWLSAVSLFLSIILMLVGIRVLGETNWAPISAMANVMQAVFAALAPGHMPINMIGSGMSGTVAANGEHLMQDYRAGKIVGSTNRNLTILQLIGVPVGAAAVAITYPVLIAKYGVGDQLPSPISQKWAGFAKLLNNGFGSLPSSAIYALLIAVVLGVVLSLIEYRPGFKKWALSPSAIGLGMLIPAWAVIPMVMGGVLQYVWKRASPKSEEALSTPLASGFITGEALVVLYAAFRAAFFQ